MDLYLEPAGDHAPQGGPHSGNTRDIQVFRAPTGNILRMLQLAAVYLAASKAPPASTASLTFAATSPGARRSGLIPLAGQRQHPDTGPAPRRTMPGQQEPLPPTPTASGQPAWPPAPDQASATDDVHARAASSIADVRACPRGSNARPYRPSNLSKMSREMSASASRPTLINIDRRLIRWSSLTKGHNAYRLNMNMQGHYIGVSFVVQE